jgi:hypothetical protein
MRIASQWFAIIAFTILMTACSPQGGTNQSSGLSPTPGPTRNSQKFATTAEVLQAVAAAQNMTTVPDSVATTLSKEDNDPPKGFFDCKEVSPAANPSNASGFGQCAWGDKNSTRLMVLYGDGHGAMWTAALAGVAAKDGWQLREFSLGGCPVPDLSFWSYETNSPNTACDAFHATALDAIKALHPAFVVATAAWGKRLADNTMPSADQWQQGWASTIGKLVQPGTKVAVLGDIPAWANSDAHCLSAHLDSVQECSAPASTATSHAVAPEQAAASAAGAQYIATTPWVCGDRCEPVIADTRVYTNEYHFTQSYAKYLTGALSEALQPLLQPSP